jgi:hypothetical protein
VRVRTRWWKTSQLGIWCFVTELRRVTFESWNQNMNVPLMEVGSGIANLSRWTWSRGRVPPSKFPSRPLRFPYCSISCLYDTTCDLSGRPGFNRIIWGPLCTIQSGVSRSSFRLLIGRLKAPHPHDYYNDSSVRSPLTCLCSFLRCVLIIAVNTGTFLELCPSTRYNDPYYLALLRMLIRLTVPVRRHK